MPHMTPVSSSMASAIGYDEEAQELHVQHPNGKVSIYSNVEPATGESITGAHSVGKALHSMVIGQYPHRYL